MLAWDDFLTGDWDEASELLDEALRVAEGFGYGLLAWPAKLVQALIASARGDDRRRSSSTAPPPGHRRARHARAGTQAPAAAAPATSPDDPGTKQRPQFEQRISPCRQAPQQPLPELSRRRAPGSPERLAARHQDMAGQAARPFPPSLNASQKEAAILHPAYGNQI